MSSCPDALYGQHGEADRDGRCPYCRRKIGPKMMRPGMDFQARRVRARGQDPLSIDQPDEGSYYDS